MTKSKTTKKTETCKCGKNCKCDCCSNSTSAFSACFLACVMTAVLVSLVFAISFTVIFNYELKHKYGTKFEGEFAKELADMRNGEMLKIDAGAVIDFYESGQTGFLYISSDSCTSCYSFEERLATAANSQEILANVYHYNYPENDDPSLYDDYAEKITLDGESAPVLLYVRDGKIYDRLDETNGEAGINAFLAKYK